MAVFDSWIDKLCTEFEGTPPCNVENISQNLISANGVYTLVVEVSIEDPTSLAGSEFRVGPLPTTALAGCPAEVEVRATGLIGRDQAGEQLWTISTLPANNGAVTNQAGAIAVEVD